MSKLYKVKIIFKYKRHIIIIHEPLYTMVLSNQKVVVIKLEPL